MDLDPAISLFSVGSLTEQLGLVLFPARIAATVLSAFGVLALILASTGIYGIMAYAVSRRSREIGIRMALGASAPQVVRVVLGRGALLLSIGAALGTAAALAASRLFAPILYGVSSTDPTTYSVALGLMAVVAFAACWFPARHAIAVDPARSLRTE
jgi:ABC-type antimicrobial peptide transport system permease subunit